MKRIKIAGISAIGAIAWLIAMLALRSARVQGAAPKLWFLTIVAAVSFLVGAACFGVAFITAFHKPKSDAHNERPDEDDSGPDGSNDDEDFDPSPRPLRGEAREFLVRTFGKQMIEEEPWK